MAFLIDPKSPVYCKLDSIFHPLFVAVKKKNNMMIQIIKRSGCPALKKWPQTALGQYYKTNYKTIISFDSNWLIGRDINDDCLICCGELKENLIRVSGCNCTNGHIYHMGCLINYLTFAGHKCSICDGHYKQFQKVIFTKK